MKPSLVDVPVLILFFNRLYVQFQTHLRLRSNVSAFYFKRTYVLGQTPLRFFLVCFLCRK